MNKLQIEHLLATQKVNSISDIICFVIEQVNKTLCDQQMQEIYLRLSEIQKPKGLDTIMIQEVKAIVEAMLDQRQQNIRYDFQSALNDYKQNIQYALTTINQAPKNSRPSLGQIEMLNFLNSNSFNNYEETKKIGFQDQFKRNRQSFNFALSKQLTRDNMMSDSTRLKETAQIDRKQVNQLKHTIMQINRSISNKLTIEEAQSIISEFQSKMYQKIQNEKLQLQKIEFTIKKQLQEQILKIKRQCALDVDLQAIKRQSATLRKMPQKLQKKLQKFKDQSKSLIKNIKNIETLAKNTQKELKINKKEFDSYCNFNNQKNQDLTLILDQINQKLVYFDKLDLMETKINLISSQIAKGLWSTQCKTKNDCIIWEKEIYNSFPQIFNFQTHKSQLLINQSGTYVFEFILFQCKISLLAGSIWVQNFGFQSSKREIKATGNNSLKFITEISQRSSIYLKILGGQNSGSVGGRGIIKISKF